MKKSLLDLSGKIESSLIDVLEEISNVTSTLEIPFLLVGATARDLILEHGYDIKSKRATLDVDLAVLVSDWDQYNDLKDALITRDNFKQSKTEHRLYFKVSTIVDIVPFGPITDSDNKFSWPPEHDWVMNCLGFEEAYNQSQRVRLKSNPDLDIATATPASLALMKIISWDEAYPKRSKDAYDLELIMRKYIDLGNEEYLYVDNTDLMDDDDFDYENISARLLGRHIAKIANPDTLIAILDIINNETGDQDRYRLVEHMMIYSNSIDDSTDHFTQNLNLLEALKKGLQDR